MSANLALWRRPLLACLQVGAAALCNASPLPADAQVLRRLDALGPAEAVVLGKARVLGEFNDEARP